MSIGLGDLLAREFGSGAVGATYTHRVGAAARAMAGKVELCNLTAGLKNELFPSLRAAFERGIIAIPSSAAIREDLHGITKW